MLWSLWILLQYNRKSFPCRHEAALPLFPETITHLGATVNPENRYSLNNALASGFVIKARREMYGGYDRYLLEKEL